MLRGNLPATIDDKGRLKIPTAFRNYIQKEFGSHVYVTSVRGESACIYPLPVWQEIEQKLARAPSSNPARQRFAQRVMYYGSLAELDAQGRVLIQPRLREAAGMTGEVDVLGELTSLEVWNHERFEARIQSQPFTDEDALELSRFDL